MNFKGLRNELPINVMLNVKKLQFESLISIAKTLHLWKINKLKEVGTYFDNCKNEGLHTILEYWTQNLLSCEMSALMKPTKCSSMHFIF